MLAVQPPAGGRGAADRARLSDGTCHCAADRPRRRPLTVTIKAVPRGTVRKGTAAVRVGERLRPQDVANLSFMPEAGRGRRKPAACAIWWRMDAAVPSRVAST